MSQRTFKNVFEFSMCCPSVAGHGGLKSGL